MSPLDASIMVPENGYIAHTNHFIGPRSLSIRDTFVSQIPNTVYRLSRTNATLKRWDSRISVDGIKEILRRARTHPDPAVTPDMQGETVASVIMDLDERSLYLTRGPPCLSEYEKYILL
jgi:isopenicillin-N N-acyltransferase-like protein